MKSISNPAESPPAFFYRIQNDLINFELYEILI